MNTYHVSLTVLEGGKKRKEQKELFRSRPVCLDQGQEKIYDKYDKYKFVYTQFQFLCVTFFAY